MTKSSNDNSPPHRDMPGLNRRHLLGGLAVAAGAGVVAWRASGDHDEQTPDGSDNESTTSPVDTSTAPPAASSPTPLQLVGVVDDDGFDLDLGPVRVSAPAGVAAPGTRITVTLLDGPPPTEFTALSQSFGPAVDVVLGEGLQPERPISLVFDLSDSPLAASVSDESPLAVFSRSDAPDSWSVLAGTWDANAQTLSVESDHLTGFWSFLLDIGSFVVEAVAGFLGVSFAKPACAFAPLTIGSAPYRIEHSGEDPIWPCLSATDGEIVVELHSNSHMTWAVTTDPSVTGRASGDYKDLGPGLAAMYQGLGTLLGDDRSAVMPGGTTRFRFDPTRDAIYIEARQAPVLFFVATTLDVVTSVLEALPTGDAAKFVLEAFETYDCFSEVINTFYQDTSPEIARSVVESVLKCLPGLIESGAGAARGVAAARVLIVIGLLTAGARAMWGYLPGIYRQVTGDGTVSYTIAAGPVAQSSGDVPMFGGNAARTGVMPGPAPDDTSGIGERWSFAAGDSIVSCPVIVGDAVYICDPDNVYSLDVRDGSERWRHRTGDNWLESSPAVADGAIFVGSYDGTLYSLDAQSGKERWRFAAGDTMYASPAAVGGAVFVGGGSRSGSTDFYALDAQDGAERWQFATGGRFALGRSVAVADETVYVASEVVYAIDARDGAERWRSAPPEGDPWSNPTVASGTVFLTGNNVYAVDAQNGIQRWRFATGGSVNSFAAVAEDTVFVGSTDNSIYAIDAESGAERWRFATGGALYSSPVIVSGMVFVGSHDGKLYALGALTSR